MRFIAFELHIEKYTKLDVCLVHVGHFDWLDDDASVLEFGWYYGKFQWDFLGINYLLRKLSKI